LNESVDEMGINEDFWSELFSEAVTDLEAEGDTYPDKVVTELQSIIFEELRTPIKPAQIKDMAQRLGRANRGNQ
jgi:hypothetical protein